MEAAQEDLSILLEVTQYNLGQTILNLEIITIHNLELTPINQEQTFQLLVLLLLEVITILRQEITVVATLLQEVLEVVLVAVEVAAALEAVEAVVVMAEVEDNLYRN